MNRIVATLFLPSLALLLAAAGEGDGPGTTEHSTVVLGEKDFDRVVSAKNGDVIELRLPNSMPYAWILTEKFPALQPLPATPRPREVVREGPKEAPPRLGGGHMSVQRYRVTTDRVVHLRPTWLYCFLNLENTKQRELEGTVPKHKEFSPDLKPNQFKEGMAFRFKLEAHP